jgi:hypothetical protein
MAMRIIAQLALAVLLAAAVQPVAGQQPDQAPVTTPPEAGSKPPETGGKPAGAAPVKHVVHRRHHPHRGHDDICSIVNGWRAFPNHDPRGYFYTGRLCCCR